MADDARFCSACGNELTRRYDERRVVTVLFADIVGFTGLSETRDPEQVKNLVDRCFARLADDITAFGGRVDKVLGDAGLRVELIPGPKELSPNCGTALRFEFAARPRAEEILGGADVEVDEIIEYVPRTASWRRPVITTVAPSSR